MSHCQICSIAAENPSLYAAIAEAADKSARKGGIPQAQRLAALQGYSLGERALQMHFGRRKGTKPHAVKSGSASVRHLLKGEARLEISASGEGSITTAETFDDTINWDDLLRLLGANPDTTCIKSDTIRVSARQVTVVDEDGTESVKTARSYSAALQPRNLQAEETHERVNAAVDEIRAAMRRPVAGLPSKGKDAAAFMIAFGDTQIGKSAGGGVEGVLQRFFDAIDRAIEAYREQVAAGYKYNSVFMPLMGDHTEGVSGNYAGQLFTVCLNKTDQDLLALELIIWAIERVRSEIGLPVTVAFVNSNHGEHSRLTVGGGGKNMTSASDTVDRMLGEVIRMRYDLDVEGPKVTVVVPGGNLVVPVNVNGVPVAIAHGHGIGARAKAATIQQELLIYDTELTETNGGVPFMPRVWITAHYHHFSVTDLGPYTHIQTPALDGGSDYFTNMSGKYSRPGLVVASIGQHFEGGIDHVRALWVAHTPKKRKPSAHERVLLSKNNERASNYSE
jgi:hypothetical protein